MIKVSIITPVFNAEKTIEDTIVSVLSQSYQNIEYIIIDGASTDGTMKVINQYKDKIAMIISESDNGIFEAMNKGLKLTNGEVVGILNADDFYANSEVITKVIATFNSNNVDILYANLDMVDKSNTNKVLRRWRSKTFVSGLFKTGWHPAHPTFFVKRKIYNKYGDFRTDLTVSADYELMLRFLEKYNISSVYLPEVLVKMRTGGRSNSSIKRIIIGNIESYKSWGMNGLRISFLRFVKKPISKLLQFIK